MSEEKINVNLDAETPVITLLKGSAPEAAPLFRNGVSIKGTLSLPRIHLENHSKWLTTEKYEADDAPINFSYVKIDKEKGSIEFVEDSGFPWQNEYKGILQEDASFTKFKINTGHEYTPIELSDFIKMNRSAFVSKSEAMKLVSTLANFEADVDNKIQQANDSRGNTNSLRRQIVTSNLPENFHIKVPIFKGHEAIDIEVEIGINPSNLSCTLISPEANDYIQTIKEDLINEEIDMISDKHPTLRIFEV